MFTGPLPHFSQRTREMGTSSFLSGSKVVAAGDLQALHLGLQGGAFQAETMGGAVGAGKGASSFAQDAENVLPLGVVQAMIERGRRGGDFFFQFRQRNV